MGAVGKLYILLREVQFEFEERGKVKELLTQIFEDLRITTSQLTDGQTMLGGSYGVDKVGHSFGLREIETPDEESAAREFAGLGESGTVVDKSLQHRLLDIEGPVTGEFHGGFARVTFRIEYSNDIVDIVESTVGGVAR